MQDIHLAPGTLVVCLRLFTAARRADDGDRALALISTGRILLADTSEIGRCILDLERIILGTSNVIVLNLFGMRDSFS